MSSSDSGRREYVLFVYDAWMSGQTKSARLAGARPLGATATEARFHLVDCGTDVALVPGGTTSVRGEVYGLDVALLASLDGEKGHPVLYKRARIRLDDGREAEAYTLDPDQVRGRRRIHSGDYRAHLTPPGRERDGGAWSRWAKSRRS